MNWSPVPKVWSQWSLKWSQLGWLSELFCDVYNILEDTSARATIKRNNAPINSKHQHPPPGKPRAFECLLCPGSREFDLKGHPGGGEFDFAWVGWGI